MKDRYSEREQRYPDLEGKTERQERKIRRVRVNSKSVPHRGKGHLTTWAKKNGAAQAEKKKRTTTRSKKKGEKKV